MKQVPDGKLTEAQRRLAAQDAAKTNALWPTTQQCSTCGKELEGNTPWGWVDISISQLPEETETLESCSAECLLLGVRRYMAAIGDSVSRSKPFMDIEGREVWLKP